MHFSTLPSGILIAWALSAAAKPTSATTPKDALSKLKGSPYDNNEIAHHLVTLAEMKHWLATTDADITFIGDQTVDATLATTVTYCTVRTGNVCGGTCKVFSGSSVCLDAPGTQCISATRNVFACNLAGCGGFCTQSSPCEVILNNKFCFVPSTNSITVGA